MVSITSSTFICDGRGTYIDSHIVTRELPRVEFQPIVGHLNLVAVNDLLLENTVAVAKTVAPGGVVERRKTVEEAGSQATKAAVAQSGIVLLLDDVLNAEAKLGQTGWCC